MNRLPPKTETPRTTSSPTADFMELREDVSSSPLWNPDLAPTTLAQRTWSTWHIAALWIGMSVVVTTYTLAGGMIEAGMTWWQAMLTILLGNSIVLIPMCLNAHAGTKYGISFPVLLRASFIMPAATLASALLLTPGGLVVAEGGITGLSVILLDLPRASAALGTLVIRFSTLWFGVIVGLLALAVVSRTLTKRRGEGLEEILEDQAEAGSEEAGPQDQSSFGALADDRPAQSRRAGPRR